MSREALIEKLIADVAAGRVVTIVGTGVSVAASGNQTVGGCKVATWTGLLEHGVNRCREICVADDDDVNLLTMQIKSGKPNFLINAAETISERLQKKAPGVFLGWLKDTVGKLEIKDRAILDAVGALPGVLCTLNYDSLLEEATTRSAVTWQNTDAVQDALMYGAAKSVLHLHGWYQEPKSVVLGLSSYLSVKDHPHAKAVLDLFTIDRTLLFVGCGDTVLDPNFTRLIDWGKEALKDVAPRHFLLCRTSEIADFQKKLTDAPWLQPLNYGDDYEDLVPFLRGLVPADVVAGTGAMKCPPTGPSFDLMAYQQAMRKRYSRLKLEELDPTTHDMRPLMLTAMFIAQSARECAEFLPRVLELPKELLQRLRADGEIDQVELDGELLQQHVRTYIGQSPRPVLEILGETTLNRLVVLGDPGSGKSTLLQYLVLQWAERADAAKQPLPLLIELREYARLRREGQVDGFLGYLHKGASVRWHLDQNQLEEWLQSNPSLILFDGLDEIFDSSLRREVSTAIHRFADEHPEARIIVTSRIFGYQHQVWRDEEFHQFMLQELDDPQIADFLQRWHHCVYEEPARGEEKRALLARAIAGSAAIRQLAGNPLLLTMMAILNRTQDLPRDRSKLYEQCAGLLLHQWKVELGTGGDGELSKAFLDLDDKRGLLQCVARTMQTCPGGLAGNLIDESTLKSVLAEGLKIVPSVRPDRAARDLIEQLRGRNFILCHAGGNSYAFVHRTMLEYFCAVEIRQRFEKEQTLDLEHLKTDIYGHWPEETWHEILCLLAGMLAPKFVAEILNWLLVQADPNETRHHVLLAVRCLGEVRQRGELGSTEAQVLERAKALTRFDLQVGATLVSLIATTWHSNETHLWLKDRAQYDAAPAVRRNAMQELARGWKDDPETLAWLKVRAQDDADPAVRRSIVLLVARGWKDDPETLAWLKDRAQGDAAAVVRLNAVRELARGWEDDPENFAILKNCVQDAAAVVRLSALQVLVRGWKDDPETLAILKTCAQDDVDPAVRQIAVRELAHGWKDDPETLAWLKTRAQNDADSGVRQITVQELARGWKDDPETLAWLKTRAQNAADPSARQVAVRELARRWKDDPETLSIVKTRAEDDAAPAVRQSAVRELARGWTDDPETLAWLETRAQDDAHPSVRRSTVRELARGWKDDPEMLAWLKTRVQDDAAPVVRLSAVRELARGWRDDPETLPILKDRAQDDVSPAVRQSAVWELARGWSDDAETLAILKTRAQDDASPAVRQSAVRELARGWKDDPETLAILKTRAQDDASPAVRRIAVRELARGWKDDVDVQEFLANRNRP